MLVYLVFLVEGLLFFWLWIIFVSKLKTKGFRALGIFLSYFWQFVALTSKEIASIFQWKWTWPSLRFMFWERVFFGDKENSYYFVHWFVLYLLFFVFSHLSLMTDYEWQQWRWKGGNWSYLGFFSEKDSKTFSRKIRLVS